MKVLTFSRFFPAGHPKEGQPTHFVEKIEACLADTIPGWEMSKTFMLHDWDPYYSCTMPKGHTIRAGARFKAGDKASLRVWSELPYRSKQIEFAQVEVKKVWVVRIEFSKDIIWVQINGGMRTYAFQNELAKNDGLELQDFIDWFKGHPKKGSEVFSGQIICWSESINY